MTMDCKACVAAYQPYLPGKAHGLMPAQLCPDVQCDAQHPRCGLYESIIDALWQREPSLATLLVKLRNTMRDHGADNAQRWRDTEASLQRSMAAKQQKPDPRVGPDR